MLAPPLLVSYSNIDEYLTALEPELREQYEAEIVRLFKAGFPPIVSSRCLAVLFGFSTNFVNAMSQQNWKYYRTFSIKQGKKEREIQAPKVALKVIQKWFSHHLTEALTFDNCVFGFVKGRSAVAAAAQHSNAKWVYSVDIENFFPSTPNDIILKALIDIGYSEKAAELMTGLFCYNDNLAQGSPASPVISNLVFKDLDIKLEKIAEDNQLRFTRYADDIVFSGTDDFPEIIKNKITNLFDHTCWQLSAEKEYLSKQPKRLKVHGLLVHGDKPRLTKGYRNKIRAYKHLIAAGKIKDKDMLRIIGHIRYAESVDKHNK